MLSKTSYILSLLFFGLAIVISILVGVRSRPIPAEVRLEVVNATADLSQERAVFVSAFGNAYKDVPLAVFNTAFTSVEDVNHWLGEVFDEEVALLREGKSFCVHALNGNDPVGVIFFERLPERPHGVYIRQTAVQPNFQRRGIGRKLVLSIREGLAVLPDTESLYLIVRVVNPRAIDFYKSAGFVRSDFMYPGYDPLKYIGFEWHSGAADRALP